MQPDQCLVYVDEASFCMSGSCAKVYGPVGQTPVVDQINSVTERVYAISGITPRGQIVSKVQNKAFNSKDLIQFIGQLFDRFSGVLNIIWDNASIHCSKTIRTFLRKDQQARERLHLYSTPVYCPWYNPDEQVWNYLKAEYMPHRWCANITELANTVRQGLDHLARLPQRIRRAFRNPDVKLFDY